MQAGNAAGVSETETACMMTPESITAYVRYEQNRGASENTLRRCRQFTSALYKWLPDEKVITRVLLLAWRQDLKEKGYSPGTELNYVKGINRYLDYIGRSDLRFNRGRSKDIGLLDFYEEQHKDDPAHPNRAQVREAWEKSKTELRSASDTRAIRSDNTSGVPGVFRKRDKWAAKITYQKVTYQLGVFETINGAAGARRAAESQLRKDPEGFAEWVLRQRNHEK